jgi:hypothetical protein
VLDLTVPVWEGTGEGNGGQDSDRAFIPVRLGAQHRGAFIISRMSIRLLFSEFLTHSQT